MALPQETFLNARWSEDQSAAMPASLQAAWGLHPYLLSAAVCHCS